MRIALPPAISAQSFAGRDAAAPVIALAGETMGTTWSVRFARPPHVDPQAVRAAIVARLDRLVREMSHWQADSLLSRFNRAAAGQWIALPPDFAQVMAEGLAIAAWSGGAFDPSIGRIVNLWGFGPVAAPHPPSGDGIDAALASAGWRRLAYDAPARRLRQPGGTMLDLSGIAKGYGVDELARVLERHGISSFLVSIDGELRAGLVKPDRSAWRVAVESPEIGQRQAAGVIEIADGALATSGDYRHFVERDGVRFAHTMDPHQHAPLSRGPAAVTVRE